MVSEKRYGVTKMTRTYFKQPFQAEQFDGSDEMIAKYELMDAGTMLGTHHSLNLYLMGSGKVNIGDWIATSINGVHWVIDGDMFKVIYKEKAVVPEYVESLIEESWGLGASVYEALGGAIDLSEADNPDEQKLGRWVKDNEKLFVRALLDYYYSKDGE